MTEILSAEEVVFNLSGQIDLQWVTGAEDPDRPLHELSIEDHATLVGHLNIIHRNSIQVIGETECGYLQSLEDTFRNSMLNEIFSAPTIAIIMADGIPVPDRLIEYSNRFHVPVLSSRNSSNDVVDIARFMLHDTFSDKRVVHGVFMEVLGTGVLIIGESSIGKSELALDLIARGHRLIADDAPEFTRTGPDILDGRSPGVLKDFMEVRGLGVINVREMYGDNALKRNKYLRLVILLKRLSHQEYSELDRLHGTRESYSILGVEVPQILIPVAPGRNIAVLVEAAVRDHILRAKGHDAVQQFIALQQRAINKTG